MNDNSNVSIQISKEIVNPIVEAKINAAIIEALGGFNTLIEKAVELVINDKVGHDGKKSSYSSDNKYGWLEVNMQNAVKTATQEAMKEILETRQAQIKQAIIKQLSTKQGIERLAGALIESTKGIGDKYWPKMDITFQMSNKTKERY